MIEGEKTTVSVPIIFPRKNFQHGSMSGNMGVVGMDLLITSALTVVSTVAVISVAAPTTAVLLPVGTTIVLSVPKLPTGNCR